jgi:GNAT superfamily N-acetyltransferase
MQVETLTGAALRAALPALGALRASVFRAWPYLYEAEPGYEGDYQSAYADSAGAGLVLASVNGEPVGAATCVPLRDETEGVRAPFVAAGLDVEDYFYFGESVLLPDYRGQGVGVAFFERREAHGLAVSTARFACFCAVQRAVDHPARPADATSLEPFWRHRGYAPMGLSCAMNWRDVGEVEKTSKTMAFWSKRLRA